MNREILVLADALANEKNLERELIFRALELALAQSTRKFIHDESDIRVQIDRETGQYETFRRWTVIEDDSFESDVNQVKISEARLLNPSVQVEDVVEDIIPNVELSRIGAQTAKQVIMQKVREAERDQVIRDFLETTTDKFVTGTVRRVERSGTMVVEINSRLEGIIPREFQIPKENLRIGDRVRAYLMRLDQNSSGARHVVLSRTAPEFITQLFRLEVPEVADGLIEIKAAARDPGVRAKIAVFSHESRVDPIGTCIGIRGTRIQAVTAELAGERVDVVMWSPDPAQFVIGALAPAQAQNIVVDEDTHTMQVVVDEDNLAMAIGSRGQNVRLASELTGWTIDLISMSEHEGRNQERQEKIVKMWMDNLDVDEDVGLLLFQNAFTSLEEVAYVPIHELLVIDGFDEELVTELRERAKRSLITQQLAAEEKLEHMEANLKNLAIERDILIKLAANDILKRDDVAEMETDTLMTMTGLSETQAQEVIMLARQHWFETEGSDDE